VRALATATIGMAAFRDGGVAGVYNRSSYAAEKRAALELWGKHVQLLIDGQKQDYGQRVVKFPTRGGK
jgi:hypothetical protein